MKKLILAVLLSGFTTSAFGSWSMADIDKVILKSEVRVLALPFNLDKGKAFIEISVCGMLKGDKNFISFEFKNGEAKKRVRPSAPSKDGSLSLDDYFIGNPFQKDKYYVSLFVGGKWRPMQADGGWNYQVTFPDLRTKTTHKLKKGLLNDSWETVKEEFPEELQSQHLTAVGVLMESETLLARVQFVSGEYHRNWLGDAVVDVDLVEFRKAFNKVKGFCEVAE